MENDFRERRSRPGRPTSWSTSETRTIRVPVGLTDTLLDIAKKLDRGDILDVDSRLIDLTVIKVYKLHGRSVVRVDDLRKCQTSWHTLSP